MTDRKRVCLLCHGAIEKGRPVYLIQDTIQEIHGPLHPRCAAKAKQSGQQVWDLIKRSHSLASSLYGRQMPLPAVENTEEELEL